MGGESEAAWRGVLDDLIARGLRTPEFLWKRRRENPSLKRPDGPVAPE
jgi:hypothetical protein